MSITDSSMSSRDGAGPRDSADPLVVQSRVIAIAGLPGSGKSWLISQLQSQGYSRYNDINRDWNAFLPKARAEAHDGQRVAISDIKFCDAAWRDRLEQELGLSVSWVFMENDPWQCAKNCLFRFLYQKPHRPLQHEIRMIGELTRIYAPYGDVRPVPRADAGRFAWAHARSGFRIG